MYSGRFFRIEKAATESGQTVTELIKRGFDGDLTIYAWGDWFHSELETPFNRHSVDSPIPIDDKKHLAVLANGKTITLHVDNDGRFIFRRDSTDDNYLDGVQITQADLYCLKSEIGDLKCNQSYDSAGSHTVIEPASTKVTDVFSKFNNLPANDVSLIIMNDGTIKIVIKGKSIKVTPDELGLKAGSQDWKLFEGAAVHQGCLENILKKLNSSRNLELEKAKIKTAVIRLRKSLKNAMGLKDNPIIWTKGSGYKFTFKTMTHELLKDGKVSKGADAMDYTDDKAFDYDQHGSSRFWGDDE